MHQALLHPGPSVQSGPQHQAFHTAVFTGRNISQQICCSRSMEIKQARVSPSRGWLCSTAALEGSGERGLFSTSAVCSVLDCSPDGGKARSSRVWCSRCILHLFQAAGFLSNSSSQIRFNVGVWTLTALNPLRYIPVLENSLNLFSLLSA